MTIYAGTAPYRPYGDGRARFAHHTIGHRTALAVSGEIDLMTSPALRRAIDRALATGALELWIDLTDTEFMDSSGVHALVDAYARMRELQRRLTIICPPGSVRRVFEVTGVSDLLPLAADRAAANRRS